jgi:nitrous oxidase accessory protein
MTPFLGSFLALAAGVLLVSTPANPTAAAEPAEIVHLAPGIHRGPITVDRPMVLDGGGEAVVEGSGRGSVVTVTAPGAVVRGLIVRGSGTSLESMDSGVFLSRTATAAKVENNRIEGNLFGVYVHGARDALVQGNRIRGRPDLRLSEAGNGISVWNAPGAVVRGNDVADVRDGIFTVTSRANRFEENRFESLRFAVHFMYTMDSVVARNVSRGNHTAFAIMFSNNVEIMGNVAEASRDHGLMLQSVNGSRILANRILGGGRASAPAAFGPAKDDEERCLFLFNANKNEIRGNRVERCPIGVHVTAGSTRNIVVANAFVGNRTQVKFVGTRHQEWSDHGRGNYWSDHAAFDLDGDGIADEVYRPNDLVDQLVWTTPLAKALLNSPAVQLVRWAQTQFPALMPGGIVDSRPLMIPPPEVAG